MATIQVGQSTFNMPAGSYAINPGSVFQTYNPSSGQTTYGSAPAGFVSGATAGNYAAVQTPQNLPSTAQVYQGDKLGYQPYSAATAFNETKPGVFASQYSQGQVPQVKPLEIPGMISVAQAEKAPTEVAKEVSKSTPTGQQIRTLEELKLYKESDLARTTGNEVYRRDVAKEQAALKEYGARYGSMPKTPEDWKKLNDIAYKGNTASNGLPVNGQVTDADGSVITTDEMGIPNAAESTTFMGQLNAIMAEITATRNELAKQEEDLAQYQEDTAMGVQDIGEQLGRSASLIGGEQGALQQRRATKENTLAKKAEILQNKLTGLNQDKQFIWQQAQQMSQNAQSNLALILNSMKGGTTTWSEMPVSQRTALENLASMAGVPSGLLSASVDAMANTTKYERESAGNDYQFIGGTENQPAGVFDKLTGTFTPTGASATGVVKSGAGNYYDIASYATDPNHESSVQSILNRIGQFKTTEDIDNYINSVAPSSPITGQMVANASNKYGVDWETITAIMQQDSSLGTAGAGARSFNPGNVGNTETATSTGKLVNFGSWQAGVDAVAKNLAWRKTTAPVSAGASTTEAYAKDILAGKMKIENVPEKIRGDVMAAKAELEKTQKPLADQLMAESLDKKILDLKYLEDSVSSDGKGVVGPSAIARMGLLSFTRLSGRAQNFIAGVEQMISQETIDKLVQSKAAGATYGALSDGERLMLASAASKIGTWRKLDSKGNIKGYNISEAALKKELSTIRELSQKARDRIMGDSVIQSNGLSEEDAYQEYLNIKNK